MSPNKMTIGQRWNAPVPRFFKAIRNIGIVIGAVGGAILSAPVSLPPILITLAGYMVTAGVVAGALSQAAVDDARTLKEKLQETTSKEHKKDADANEKFLFTGKGKLQKDSGVKKDNVDK